MDLLTTLSKNHVLTAITGCEASNGSILGVQLTYGVWNPDGSLTNVVSLQEIGKVAG